MFVHKKMQKHSVQKNKNNNIISLTVVTNRRPRPVGVEVA